MGWRYFLKAFFPDRSRNRRTVRRRPASCRPAVEALETRTVPSISFHAAGNYSTGGSGNTTAATGDFNHDGAIDLATVNKDNSTVGVLLGRGDGTFAGPVTYSVGTAPYGMTAGDFNGDGNLDLAVGDFAANVVWLLRGKGDGTFDVPTSHAAGSSPYQLAVADFNRDGKPDLAVTLISNGNSWVGVLINDGSGGFQAPVSYAAGNNPLALAVGDFNGDGKPDLATANTTASSLSVLINDGSGGFRPAVNYGAGNGGWSTYLAVGDFNGDGKPDLALMNANNSGTIFLNNGSGSFAPGTNFSLAIGSPRSIAVGDFNRDGKTDLALGFEKDTYLYSFIDYNPPPFWPYDYFYYDVYQTDVGISVLEGSGNGTFISETDVVTYSYLSESGPLFAPMGGVPVADPIYALAVGDFDGNSYPDIVGIESFGTADVAINTQLSPQFTMTFSPATAAAGSVLSVTISALDHAGNPYPSYTGTVHFTSSDYQAVLPADYTFTAADHGVHTFSVSLKTAGAQSLTVADQAAFASATTSITVTPAAASSFSIGGPYQPSSGATGTLVLTAVDPYGNVATGYTGTVHFSSSDAAATLPGNYTFTAADGGVQSFYAILRTAGPQTVTVTDTQGPVITGQTVIDVLPVAGLAGPAAGTVHQDLTFTLRASSEQRR